MCTWRETANGARIIGLSTQSFMDSNYKAPGTKELIENILAYLAAPSAIAHVPMLSPLGVGAATAILAETGRRIIASSNTPNEGQEQSERDEA